ncbi:hypothetical protein [Nocardioides sp. B-3]|uniref:hypothetical protein n=1 Tax=Nocardioides sp. B-3 TaxID=2895565 RepID=UPI0021523F78|nr:hypothetical protein [Nocardioides sp. B-3]UUZ58181.1 hypothetical protein LP418_18170 [Nocardioides sp. B-3]
MLSRDNARAEEVYDALTGAGIPVEIVGLSGLIRLPEVAEVVATLSLLHDVTANAAVLTLLAGPRWAIGPRDLRLLAERAAEIGGGRDRSEAASIAQQLLRIADGIDTSELPALSDALADPGDAPYSPEARALRPARRRAAPTPRPCRRPAPRRRAARHRHHRGRRRAGLRHGAGRRRPPRQPRPLRQGRRGVPVGRRRRDTARAAGLPHRRGRPGATASTSPPPPPPTRSSC